MLSRRKFLKMSSLASLGLASGCGYLRIDPMHVLIRSDVILSLDQEREILSRAKVAWTEDGAIRVLYVQGTPYECGYQHGALLRTHVQNNIGYMYRQALKTFRSKEFFAEAYERIRPYIPQRYIEEMHGLAHGAKMPLEVIHHIHALPSMTEWGGKKRIKKLVKEMMQGDLGTSCSNLGAFQEATVDGKIYAVRILDWGLHRISKLHQYPLITVGKPSDGLPYANIGWVGFLGAVSGMNEQGITLGEMGYGSPPHETLRGKPMIFLLRDVLNNASNLGEVRRILRESIGTNSFSFLMTDGKSGQAELYVKDRERFVVFEPGKDHKDGEMSLPGIAGVSYGGHYEGRMHELLSTYSGQLSPEVLMDVIVPQIVMKSNFQNVVYDPQDLRFWVSNAADRNSSASTQPYTLFDFRAALRNFN